MAKEIEIVSNSGDPKTFYKWRLNSLILKMVYPQILSNFVVKFGSSDLNSTKQALRNIGINTAKRVLKEFPIEEYNPKILIRKLTYRHWGTKSKIIGKIKDGEMRIVIKKCALCENLSPLEIEGLHYCISFAGFLEGAFEVLQKKFPKMTRKKFTFDTIASRGSSAPKCVHICKIEG
ncbi:MAG: hypothetical protein ACTSPY_00080 [Candidatus Helarchaeota archaeon]